jgi:SAM-dependent methyltransferase
VSKTVRVMEGQRLAYYREAASAQYWDDVWARQETRDLYLQAEKGELGYYAEIFPKYLPKTGRILEAGSGLGQFVMALRVRGYDIEGVDYGAQTVRALNGQFPDLPIREGDVTRLNVPDGFYQGYISLGVMEHRQQGPEPFLSEAYRVLAPGGVALISTPFLNPIRRLKKTLGLYKGSSIGLDFYQYLFSQQEFDQCLQSAGFELIAHHQYGGYKGVKDEIIILNRIFEWPQIGWRLRKWLMNSRFASRNVGHMMMYVCRKMA